MLFSVTEFNGLLGQMQQFAWRKADACPCISPASGAPLDGCPVCNGRGRIWSAETAPVISGCQTMRNDRGFAMFGTWEGGDALFTVGSNSPLYGARQYDRIRCLNATSPFSSVVVPGTNDKLMGTIVAITRVFWLTTDGTAIVEGGIPDVGSDGSLTWPVGQLAPPDDTQFSIAGTKYDEFFVYMNLPANRNNDLGAALPRKFLGRRFDLFRR